MLTFERLVLDTAQRLSTTYPDITPEVVRDVLQDTGVDECLRDSASTPQGRLIVHYVDIEGEKSHGGALGEKFRYTRALGTGLWAWVGSNGTGKSTILNCILWALTGSDNGIPRRIRPWIRDVLVHFSVGDERFTSHVSRAAEGVTGGIYHGWLTLDQIHLGTASPVILSENRDAMREAADLFFMQRLGITTLRWTAHSAEKDDPDLHAHSTTWRTYAHAIHIDDDSYDDLIIDPTKGYGRQDRKILEMMLGVEHSRAVAEIQVQADFAKEAYGRARSRASGRQSTVASQIAALELERLEVEQAITGLGVGTAPVEDDSVFVAKRGQRSALLTEQNQLAQDITVLEAQVGAIEYDLLEAERKKTAAQEQNEVEYLINSLVVVRCPHCESPVDAEARLASERDSRTCHVCSQPIQRVRSQGDAKAIIRERDQEIATLRASLRHALVEIAEKQQRLAASRDESARLSKELEVNVRQARDGFSASYATLLVRKGQIDGQLDQLRRSLSEMEAEQAEVATAARWNVILQMAVEIADRSVFEINEKLFAELGDLVVKLATLFGLPDLEQVQIDEKRYIRLTQGGVAISHNDLARSERVKFKVAFHLALMLLRVRSGLGRHPGFLVIDTPGTAEVDEADFVAMTRDLTRIHQEYGQQVQILLASARPEALQQLPAENTASALQGTFF